VTRSAVALTFLIAAGGPRVAAAHESPHGLQLVWSTPEREAAPVILTNRGLVFAAQPASEQGYSLRCNEAYGVNTSAEPYAFVDDAGRLGLVTYKGVHASSDRGCSWADGSGLPGVSLGGFAQNPQRPGELLVTTQSYQVPSQIFVSHDYGRSWSLRATNQPSTAYQALLSAPDGTTLFASGNRFDAASKKLVPLWARSSDGGSTWEEQELVAARHPLAVHPMNAQVVFARAPDALATSAPRDELLRSEDGGKTFTTLLGMAPISAFAATPDGATMWVGSGTGGLYRSDDGGKSFAQVGKEQILGVYCLHQRLDRLWLCARWAPNRGGVWSSDDRGESWSLVLGFDQVSENARCAPEQEAVCEQPWRDWEYELLGRTPGDAGVSDDAGGAEEAGAEADAESAQPEAPAEQATSPNEDPQDAGPPAGKESGANCSVGAPPALSGGWWMAALLGVIGFLYRGPGRDRGRSPDRGRAREPERHRDRARRRATIRGR
jgi:photosystem II stability/assembly factor-like uncharacterized protein